MAHSVACATPTFSGCPSRYTGKERDSESGNDFFGARYYASSMGRWLSPDWSAQEEPVPYAKLDDPQTLNLYSYVQNNPLTSTDPTGHDGCCEAPTIPDTVGPSTPGYSDYISNLAGDALEDVVKGGLGVVGFLFTAGVQSTAPASADQLYNEETGKPYHEPEPQTSTSGAGARKGGGLYADTPENRARIAEGKAPIGNDGHALEDHHVDQTMTGGTKTMTRTEHRLNGNFAKNHTNTGKQKSKIDRNKFKQQVRQEWLKEHQKNQNQQ